jgi:hypothetical protein
LRVEGEIVRDVALSAAGLLDERIGGPSVFPPQPPGISESAYTPFPWPTSDGPDRYRRGLYTYLKRTTPYPTLITFDGPRAETTCTRRNRANTPLQALATLNDTVFVEAAQHMAERVMKEANGTEDRARYAMRLCIGRVPDDDEVNRIVAFYEKESKRKDVSETAAWTLVCRSLLNLDETLTKG